MLPVDTQITNQDIRHAERILLKPNQSFDIQAKDFIKSFETADLQAVPGSGKTTVLLAKLLILEKRLPSLAAPGVLVISHTNAAVDEINKRIGANCPKLTRYPHFLGTIQSFVDHFLAVPYYNMKYGRAIKHIDDDIYYAKHYIPAAAQGFLRNRPNGDKILKDSRLLEDDRLGYMASSSVFPLTNPSTPTYQAIHELKTNLRNAGILSYQDAYILADEYLNRYPGLRR